MLKQMSSGSSLYKSLRAFSVAWIFLLMFQVHALDATPQAAQVSPLPQNGIWLDTCFSPNESCDQKLIRFISSSKLTLQIAIYSLTHKGITQAIVDAHRNGRQVQVIVDRVQAAGNYSQVNNLKAAGIPVKFGNMSPGNARAIMHNKYTLVDGVRLETGSFNYTENATSNNAENQFYTDEANIVNRYMKDFQKLFAEGLDQ